MLARAIIRSSEADGQLSENLPAIVKKLRKNSKLIGATLFNLEGEVLFRFGEATKPLKQVEKTAKSIQQFDRSQQRLDLILSSERLKAAYSMVVAVNSSEVAKDVEAFIWRIAGLVLLISVFVTLVTMLVLEKLVLAPI
ncbi:MAG: adenylate cyclase [Parasphingorhabdus sp.]